MGGGSSVTRGDATNSRCKQELTIPEKRRGKTRGSSVTRGGQVEVPPDGRRWRDKKLRWWRTRGNTTASRGRQETQEQGQRPGREGGNNGIYCSIHI
jgi:hypothetical protein